MPLRGQLSNLSQSRLCCEPRCPALSLLRSLFHTILCCKNKFSTVQNSDGHPLLIPSTKQKQPIRFNVTEKSAFHNALFLNIIVICNLPHAIGEIFLAKDFTDICIKLDKETLRDE